MSITQAIITAAKHWNEPVDSFHAKPIPNDFFRHWQFYRVEDDSLPPLVSFVATGDEHRAVTVDLESGLSPILTDESPVLETAADAVRFVEFFLSLAKPLMILLTKVSEIPRVSTEEQTRWSARIHPPVARGDQRTFTVDAFVWDEGALKTATFTIRFGQEIESRFATIAPKVGRVISLE